MAVLSLLYSLLLIACCSMASGADYEYVVVFMENFVEEAPVQQDVELYVASRSTSVVTVTIDNPNGNLLTNPISFNLAPEKVEMRPLTSAIRLDNGLSNKAIRVVGNGDIIVYALNRNLYSTDGFTAFRVDQTGKEYYALAYTPLTATQIAVVAVEDGTTVVEIRVPADTTMRWQSIEYTAGQTITITLDRKYRTAQVATINNGDLTGAQILSDKRISVFSGNVRTNVNGDSRDHLVDQLPPMEQWGFTYYTVRTPGRSSDRMDLVRVVAHLDNTNVQVNGARNENFKLDAGQYKELSTDGPLFIDSGNQSVMVGIISPSQSLINKDLDEGDPSMVIMPAVGQYSNDYIFSTPSYIKPTNSESTQYDIHVLIIAKTAELNGLKLNGATLINPSWTVIAGTDYSTGRVAVDNDKTYNLKHDDADVMFMALLYGSADRESFYFPIDVGQANINVITPVYIEGNKGEKGAKGARGPAGVQGPKGLVGATGDTGFTGLRGATGSKGPKGEAGSSSQVGATGATGPSGVSGRGGQIGAAGLQGAAGATGATGATGAQGPKGYIGYPGYKGEPGVPGDAGAPGARGSDGSKGEKGAKGATGLQGARGADGYEGSKGYVAPPSCAGKCSVANAPTKVATCRSTFGTVGHVCSCPSGFHLLERNMDLCVDIDECDLELCSHDCENTVGSYICHCPPGYTNTTGNNCVDVDECKNNPCGTDVCINGIGSYICLSPTSPQAQVSKSSLQKMISNEFFIAVLCLLLLMTLIVVIVAICLLNHLRSRRRVEKVNSFAAFHTLQSRPASVIMQDKFY